MPRFRFQIRALMAFVAIVAVTHGAVILNQRRTQDLRERAYYHNAASHQLEMDAGFSFCGFGIPSERSEQLARKRAAERKLQLTASEYHRLLSSKYQAAAAQPWYPISSDPPPPPLANPKLVTADDY
jgi:hypothetical protein